MTDKKRPVLLFVMMCIAGFALATLSSCSSPQARQPTIKVQVQADGDTQSIDIQAGSSVQQVLDRAGVGLGTLDRTEPVPYSTLNNDSVVKVIRVKEEFSQEELVNPFERRILQTESLPIDQELLAQRGENGKQEITYRIVYEDGVVISRSQVGVSIVKEAIPEILMVGIQAPYAPINIPGRLMYLLGGNAWMMEGNTGVRKPVITTGDLDGRIFSLSGDGEWLLFTRRSEEENQINTLWAANITNDPIKLMDLRVANIVHFADWVPGSTVRVAYSTVTPSQAAPGWQANADLRYLTIYKSGAGSFSEVKLKQKIGGSYGWWGIQFTWAPHGNNLAFANSDGIGILGITKEEAPQPLVTFPPYQTRADWAWLPGISWSPDGQVLFTVQHVPADSSTIGSNSQFDLMAIPMEGSGPLRLASNIGMFAYPVASPSIVLPNGEMPYQVAFLQAKIPEQSASSTYRLDIIDRDGSNRRELFPGAGEQGLEPQQVVWSPSILADNGNLGIALLYRGNLWLIDSETGQARQVTGDGLTSRLSWR